MPATPEETLMRTLIAIVGLVVALQVQPARGLVTIGALGTSGGALDVEVVGDLAYVWLPGAPDCA